MLILHMKLSNQQCLSSLVVPCIELSITMYNHETDNIQFQNSCEVPVYTLVRRLVFNYNLKLFFVITMFLVLSSQPCGSNTYFISIVTTNWLGLLLPLRYCGCCCSFWRRTRIVIDNSRGELEWRWKWIRFLLLTFHMTVNFCSGSIILHYFPAACIKSPLRQIKTFLLFGQVCLSSWRGAQTYALLNTSSKVGVLRL